jgi:hypothetical protein
MNNSPFEIFRRNLKPLMILLTGLALFAFVVLPVVQSSMNNGMVSSGDGVVARFNDIELTGSRVEYFTRNHQSTVRFLVELAEATIARGGYPRTAGFRYDEQNGQVQAIGINQSPSTDSTVRTFMLASEANEAGFELDDSSLRLWLERYTDGMISNSDIDAMLMQSTQQKMGRPHLYEQLRNHLLATVFLTRGYSTLYLGESPMTGALVTPEEQWSNFLKLNRTAVANTYAVMVEDYVPQTNKTPSEEEILATYEEGKDTDLHDQSPDPAFHRRYSVKFEYLVGDYKDFLNDEIDKLSEEDIRAEYERRLTGGDFQLPDNAASEMLQELKQSESQNQAPGEEAAIISTDEEAAIISTDEEAAIISTGEEAAIISTDEEAAIISTGEEAAEETKDEQASPSNENEPADEPADDGTSPTADASEASHGESESDESAPEGGDAESDNPQSSVNRVDAVRLVAFQQQDEEGSPATDQDDSAADTKETADDSTQQTETKDPAAESDQAPVSDTAKSDSEKDATATDAKPAASEDPKQETEQKPEDTKPEDTKPEVESFEDVRDQIAEEMAGPAARQRMDTAITEINSQMQLYFNKRSIHDSYVEIGKAGEPPVKPDLKQLAGEMGMTYEVIGPYSEVTIADEPIADSRDVGTQFGGRGPGFSVIMYGFNNGQTELPRQQLFVPVRTADDPAGKIYVSWKIDETEAYTPTLAEARDEVVMAIRTKEARKLARAAAEEIVKQASETEGTTLRDVVKDRDDYEDYLVEAGAAPAQPFKWLDMIPGMGIAPGNVPELDSVGNEFMEAVFNTKIGEYGVAANDPQRVIFVVQPTKVEPSAEELKAQYQQPINRMMATFIGNDTDGILSDFYKAVDEQAGLVNYLESDF